MMNDSKLSAMSDNLFVMADKLMKGDINNPDEIKMDIDKANAIVNIANTVIGLQQMELSKAEMEIKMCKVADHMCLKYVPSQLRGCEQIKPNNLIGIWDD